LAKVFFIPKNVLQRVQISGVEKVKNVTGSPSSKIRYCNQVQVQASELHMAAAEGVLRYLAGTPSHGITYTAASAVVQLWDTVMQTMLPVS